MGGDDLDDEHLMWIQKVKATHSESSDDDVNDKSLDDEKNTKGKKRKLDTAVALTTEPLDQKKKSKSPAQLLLQSGRNIELQDAVEQAAFLTTAVKHYSLLEQQQQIDANGDVASTESLEILPQYCLGKPTTNCTKESSLLDRVREAISVKKMKQWKNVGSPCVVRLEPTKY